VVQRRREGIGGPQRQRKKKKNAKPRANKHTEKAKSVPKWILLHLGHLCGGEANHEGQAPEKSKPGSPDTGGELTGKEGCKSKLNGKGGAKNRQNQRSNSNGGKKGKGIKLSIGPIGFARERLWLKRKNR